MAQVPLCEESSRGVTDDRNLSSSQDCLFDEFVQLSHHGVFKVILTTLGADLSGDILDNKDCSVLLVCDRCKTWFSFSALTQDTFHVNLLVFKSGFHISGSGR